jgi:hypothetical protein
MVEILSLEQKNLFLEVDQALKSEESGQIKS